MAKTSALAGLMDASSSPELDESNNFFNALQTAINRGHGFVPLIGAGMSAEAGVAIGRDLLRYVRLCVADALGLVRIDDLAHLNWDPEDGNWPRMEGNWVLDAEDAWNKIVTVALHLRVIKEGDESCETQDRGELAKYQDICRQAYGALSSDWRSGLQFLARIKTGQPRTTAASRFVRDYEFSVRHRYGRFPELKESFDGLLNDTVWTDEDSAPEWVKVIQNKYPELVTSKESVKGMLEHTADATKEQKKLIDSLNNKVSHFRPLELEPVRQHIVDSFFNHLVQGKKPAMSHRMLVHLLPYLRSQLVLSLNFDELMEEAARESRTDVNVINVHQDASLPPAHLLGSGCTIVKVHGSQYGLRADHTLDGPPTEADRASFRSYVAAPEYYPEILQTENLSKKGNYNNIKHLLVLGVSGNETRVCLLIQDALDAFKNLHVYWYCHSSRTEETVQERFKDYKGRIIPVKAPHVGMLLWEVYHKVTRSLPPSGVEFPTTWNHPYPPKLTKGEKADICKEFRDEIAQAECWLTRWQSFGKDNKKNSNVPRSVLVLETKIISQPDVGESWPRWKLNSLAWHFYEVWTDKRNQKCLWLNSEDFCNCSELQIRLIQTAGRLTGQSEGKPSLSTLPWRYTNLPPDEHVAPDRGIPALLSELTNLLSTSGQRCVLFLNLRGAPKYNAGSFGRFASFLDNFGPTHDHAPKEWLEEFRNLDEFKFKQGELQEINRLVERMGFDQKLRKWLSIVVLSDQKEQFDFSNESLFERILLSEPKQDNWLASVANDALDWVREGMPKDSKEKAQMLRALMMFQHVHHRSAFVTRAIVEEMASGGSWEDMCQKVDGYLDTLIEKHVIRAKPGGFLWMHWHVREYLRCELSKTEVGELVNESRYHIHLALADWYATFFRSTGDPLATFQAVYHRCRVAQLCFKKSSKIQNEDEADQYAVRARGALCQAANHLEQARASLVSRGHPLDAEKCLDGYVELLKSTIGKEVDHLTDCSSDKRIARALRNLRFLTMLKVRAQLYRIWFYRDIGKTDLVLWECEHLKACFDTWRNKKINKKDYDNLDSLYQREWPDESKHATTWCSFEEAVASISLRRYRSAEKGLKLLALEFHFDIGDLHEAGTDKVWGFVNQWNQQRGNITVNLEKRSVEECPPCPGNRFDERRMLIYIFRRLMEVCLLKVEAKAATSKTVKKIIQQGQAYYRAARMMMRYTLEPENSSLRIELSRLHSVMAGMLAIQKDDQGVHRHLNEARGLLAGLPQSEESIALAVVDLREIYCKLESLGRLPKFQMLRRSISGNKQNGNGFKSEADLAQSLLDDIAHGIRRAEHRITRNRKSLWWWFTLSRYKMVHLEYSATIMKWRSQQNKNIHLSDTLHRQNDLLALKIIDDTMNRVTTDPYQLARITDSFLKYCELRVGADLLKQELKNALGDAIALAKPENRPSSKSKDRNVRANWADHEIVVFVDKVLARLNQSSFPGHNQTGRVV